MVRYQQSTIRGAKCHNGKTGFAGHHRGMANIVQWNPPQGEPYGDNKKLDHQSQGGREDAQMAGETVEGGGLIGRRTCDDGFGSFQWSKV